MIRNLAKRIAKTKQDIIGEEYIGNDDVLAVIDEDNK